MPHKDIAAEFTTALAVTGNYLAASDQFKFLTFQAFQNVQLSDWYYSGCERARGQFASRNPIILLYALLDAPLDMIKICLQNYFYKLRLYKA